jgi:hypothetical protein
MQWIAPDISIKIRLDLKVGIDKTLPKPTISSFYYSIISGLRQISMPQKYRFYSTGCRKSARFKRSDF